MSALPVLLLLVITTKHIISQDTNVCVWGRDVMLNTEINGEFIFQGTFNGGPWYIKEEYPTNLFYLYRCNMSSNAKYCIGPDEPTQGAYCGGSADCYAYCGTSTSTPWDCDGWKLFELTEGGFQIDPNVSCETGPCPEWNCDQIETSINYERCQGPFSVKQDINTWSNTNGDRFFYFNYLGFNWICNDEIIYEANPSETFAFAERKWIDNSMENSVSIHFTTPFDQTQEIQCIQHPTNEPTQQPTTDPSETTHVPTNNPSNNPTNAVTNEPSQAPTNNPSFVVTMNPISTLTPNEPSNEVSNHPTPNPDDFPTANTPQTPTQRIISTVFTSTPEVSATEHAKESTSKSENIHRDKPFIKLDISTLIIALIAIVVGVLISLLICVLLCSCSRQRKLRQEVQELKTLARISSNDAINIIRRPTYDNDPGAVHEKKKEDEKQPKTKWIAEDMNDNVDNVNNISTRKNTAVSLQKAVLVEDWLKEIGLSQYYGVLISNGYDSLPIIKEIVNASALEDIGIICKPHQKYMLSEIRKLENAHNVNNYEDGERETVEGEADDNDDDINRNKMAIRGKYTTKGKKMTIKGKCSKGNTFGDDDSSSSGVLIE